MCMCFYYNNQAGLEFKSNKLLSWCLPMWVILKP